MTEFRRWINLIEAVESPLRSEILRLYHRLPARWRAEDGSEVWKNYRFEAWLAAQSDDELADIRDNFEATLAYLAANPKATLSNPLKTRLPRAKAATLNTLLSRAGRPFEDWLTKLLADDPDDLARVLKTPVAKREYLTEYLSDELSITVLDNGLVTFWTLRSEGQNIKRLIGDLPVALYHFTSSRVVRAIRSEGLRGNRATVNRRTNEGVYLTTETSGPAVTGYIRNAISAHGGNPVMLTIKCYLNDLAPDPDDADISSGQHQFVIEAVAPEQIISVQAAHY